VKLTSKVVKYGSQPLKLGDRLPGVSILGVSLEPSSFVVEEHLRNEKWHTHSEDILEVTELP